jgi:hypothetical protein
MTRSILILGCWLGAVLLCPPAHAGPWIKKPLETYVKVHTSYYAGARHYDSPHSDDLRYSAWTISTYAEMGLPYGFQMLVALPFQWASHRSQTGLAFHNYGVGDIQIQVDYGIWDGLPLSVGVEVKVPAYEDPDSLSAQSSLSSYAASFPRLGDNGFDVVGHLQGGLSWPQLEGWFALDIAYRKRLASFQDALEGRLTTGAHHLLGPLGVELFIHAAANVTTSDKNKGLSAPTNDFAKAEIFLIFFPSQNWPTLGLQSGASILTTWPSHAVGYGWSLALSLRP